MWYALLLSPHRRTQQACVASGERAQKRQPLLNNVEVLHHGRPSTATLNVQTKPMPLSSLTVYFCLVVLYLVPWPTTAARCEGDEGGMYGRPAIPPPNHVMTSLNSNSTLEFSVGNQNVLGNLPEGCLQHRVSRRRACWLLCALVVVRSGFDLRAEYRICDQLSCLPNNNSTARCRQEKQMHETAKYQPASSHFSIQRQEDQTKGSHWGASASLTAAGKSLHYSPQGRR